MTTRVLLDTRDRDVFVRLLSSYKLPCTVTVTKGKRRSEEQNKLQRKWLSEAAEQLADETAEEKRAYCKLHFGVPIMRNGDSDICREFRDKYDRIIRPLPYEQKLELMAVPMDFPVTRLMSTKQKTEYLDAMYQHFRGLGVELTEPER